MISVEDRERVRRAYFVEKKYEPSARNERETLHWSIATESICFLKAGQIAAFS